MSRDQQERERAKSAFAAPDPAAAAGLGRQPPSLAGSHLRLSIAAGNTLLTPAFMGDGRQRRNGYLVSAPSALFDPLGQTRPRYLEHLADGQRDSAPVRIALIARSVRSALSSCSLKPVVLLTSALSTRYEASQSYFTRRLTFACFSTFFTTLFLPFVRPRSSDHSAMSSLLLMFRHSLRQLTKNCRLSNGRNGNDASGDKTINSHHARGASKISPIAPIAQKL